MCFKFNTQKIRDIQNEIDLLKIKCATTEDARIEVEEELSELKKQIIKNPKEDELNNKYPQSDVYYTIHETDGDYEIDVRTFIESYDFALPSISGLNDDEKALNCLKWVIENVKYTDDKKSYGFVEYWAHPYQTLKRKVGDCEDGAILLYSIMLKANIPYWKIRISAGDTPFGGHAYITYYCEEADKWIALDWCYYPEQTLIKDRVDYKENKLYGGIWFSFNQKYSYSLNGTKLKWSTAKHS